MGGAGPAKRWPLGPWREGVQGLVLLLVLPALATLLSVLSVLVPVEPVRAAVLEAFEQGELVDKDYLPTDTQRGIDQFTDCLVLQSALYRSSDALRSALGASILDPTPKRPPYCSRLRLEAQRPGSQAYVPYYRYWHGNKSVELFLLGAGLSVRHLRWLLSLGSYAAILSFALLALRRSLAAGRALGVLAIFGAGTSALAFMGPLLSHAPGYLFVWLAAAGLVAREAAWSVRRLAAVGFVLGFFGTYVDMLASMPLLALLPLAAVGLARQAEGRPDATRRGVVAGGAAAAGIVWALLSKQLLAGAVFGWHQVLEPFASQLLFRVGASGLQVTALGALGMLLDKAYFLSFGQRALLLPLLGLSLAGVGVALAVAPKRWLSLLTLAVNGGLLFWYVLFKNHTANHPELMVRLLFLPCAWSWAVAAGSPRWGSYAAPSASQASA